MLLEILEMSADNKVGPIEIIYINIIIEAMKLVQIGETYLKKNGICGSNDPKELKISITPKLIFRFYAIPIKI